MADVYIVVVCQLRFCVLCLCSFFEISNYAKKYYAEILWIFLFLSPVSHWHTRNIFLIFVNNCYSLRNIYTIHPLNHTGISKKNFRDICFIWAQIHENKFDMMTTIIRIFLEWWLRICLLKDNIGLLLFVIMARSTRINKTKARKELIVESTDSIEPENMQNEPVNNECNKGKIENTYVVSSMKRITFFTHYTDIYIYIYIYIRSLHSYTAILHI